MYHMIHNGLYFTDFFLLWLRSSTMNLSVIIQVSDLLILSNYLLCNYLHSVNKCILDYLTKLWYHARIMQERELGEKVYFCIDTSFFLYSYTTWKVVMTHERYHLFTWVSVEQTSVVINLYIKKKPKEITNYCTSNSYKRSKPTPSIPFTTHIFWCTQAQVAWSGGRFGLRRSR
jgi:hypothetical protein